MATRETWTARVREWKRSGLTAADHAEREGFNARTELGRSTLAIARPPVVEVMVAQRSASALEVMLPSGVKIAVPVDFVRVRRSPSAERVMIAA